MYGVPDILGKCRVSGSTSAFLFLDAEAENTRTLYSQHPESLAASVAIAGSSTQSGLSYVQMSNDVRFSAEEIMLAYISPICQGS